MVNYEMYHIDTRQQYNFHQPSVNLTGCQKRVYYLSVNVFNPLNAELSLICYLLALLEPQHFLHVSRIRVNMLPSYIKIV